jgi:hypothetical protein
MRQVEHVPTLPAVEALRWRAEVAETRRRLSVGPGALMGQEFRARTSICVERRLDELAAVVDDAARKGRLQLPAERDPKRKKDRSPSCAPRRKLIPTEASLLNLTLRCHRERHSQARRVSETGKENIMRATSARQENLLIIQTLQEQIAWAIRCRAMSLA